MSQRDRTSWMSIVLSDVTDRGIPLPLFRDRASGKGSVSLTLVVISSVVVVVGLTCKWSKYLGEIDISNALQFFYASCGLYWGRRTQTKSGTIDGDQRDAKPSDDQVRG